MADAQLNWLRRECVVAQFSAILNTAVPTLSAPADPMRFVVIIRPFGASVMYAHFSQSGSDVLPWIVDGNRGTMVFSEDEFGDYITKPLMIQASSGTPLVVVTTLSYCPCKWSSYERIGKQISG